MPSFESLFEDEDDIFSGTPKSKYWDFARHLSDDNAEEMFDTIVARFAAMEEMLLEQIHEDDINRVITSYIASNSEKIEMRKKSLYMEFAGELVMTLDS